MSDARTQGMWAEIGGLLRAAWMTLRRGGARLIGLLFAMQVIISVVAFPLFGWLFREALRAGGMHGLDLGNLASAGNLTLTLALIIVIALIAFLLLSLQFTIAVAAVRRPGVPWGELASELGRIVRKLLRPSSLPLYAYLFLLLPLSGFGFLSVITQGIALPSFISGELMKSTSGQIGLVLLVVVLALLNLRFALTLPVFVFTNASGGQAMRGSWRLTRGLRAPFALVVAILAVFVAAGIATFVLLMVVILPTILTDTVAPEASPLTAAYSLGIAQVVGLILSCTVTACFAAILVQLTSNRDYTLEGTKLRVEPPNEPAAESKNAPRASSIRPGLVFAVVVVVGSLLLGTAQIETMHRLSQMPETLVLGHRGFSEGGVENTLSGLDAAKQAGADLVEMDVMQTADGKFVAMHDATLERLAEQSVAVKDLTLEEITSITVRDQFGNEDVIPPFADYVTYAAEIGMPLLIEIKMGGADTPDHVDLLVDELEELGLLHANIYHTLDAESVERLKTLRPDVHVGYIMAFAGGGVPDTPADFIVVEEWTATEEMQHESYDAGLGFFTWTVNDEAGMREHLRRNTDAIITDHPDLAVSNREEMQHESGLAMVLLDAFARFVTVV